MNPATMQMMSAEHGREMREQAAAWRRAREGRSADRARPTRIPLALIARNARFLARQKQLEDPAAV
jgi:hypothetical protein